MDYGEQTTYAESMKHALQKGIHWLAQAKNPNMRVIIEVWPQQTKDI